MKASNLTSLYCDSVSSPVGNWIIYADNEGVTAIDYSIENIELSPKRNITTDKAKTQLQEYFAGNRTHFDLELSLNGYSAFYNKVWKALQSIRYGETTSYSALATALDNPKAVRAVGTANGKNPIPIIIPCHRVIGKDKSLTGYAHGLKVKRWLLELEGALTPTPTLFD